ncbi:BQ5605_C006g04006 [Microbotryum silenes-dioicae]|uniref:BQ5605_C006g04006 protein n=1 Tax=Microbotryum silenes-dioicae TaxID=796604 RepID=A0A2X0M5P0_9BASI|nr:BQ5605_C006g04006 [Microbotryum silenes-dioicae]
MAPHPNATSSLRHLKGSSWKLCNEYGIKKIVQKLMEPYQAEIPFNASSLNVNPRDVPSPSAGDTACTLDVSDTAEGLTSYG